MRDEPPAGDRDDQRDRGGREERPAPPELGQRAAEDQPGREAARPERGVDAQRAVASLDLGEVGRDDRQRRGRGEGRRGALDQARGDEQVRVAGQRAEQRGHGEHRHRDEEHAPAAEQVRGPAAEQEQPAVAEHVAAHHPLQLGGREAEVRADGRQRDPDHRHVEAVEEDRAADGDEEAQVAALQEG